MRLTGQVATATLLCCLSVVAQASQEIKRTKDPALSPDGKTVAFAWQGDIWTVPVAGGEARRLTVYPADEGFPTWTPDGKSIVFQSNRYGNYDLFLMSADGSGLKRLTYDSSNEYPTAVSADGEVYGYSTQWGRLDLFRVSIKGGDLIRLTGHPLEMEFYASLSPDGKTMLYNSRGSAGNWRKPGHHGSSTTEVWSAKVGVPLTGIKQVTNNDTEDLFPTYINENTALTVSNPDGQPNLYLLDLRNGKSAKVTQFKSGTLRSPSYSAVTKTAVYQKDSELYATQVESGKTQKVVVSAPDDMRRNPVQEFRMDAGVRAMDVSPNGKLAVIEVRGDLYLLPATGGTTRQLTKNVRPDGSPGWLNDTTILYEAAGDGGLHQLMTVTTDGVAKPFYRHTTDSMSPKLSPDRKWVAFHRGNREICVLPATGGTPKVVATGDFSDAFRGAVAFSWSPDSQWLAYETQDARSVGIYMVKRDGSGTTLVARAGKGAGEPVFSADGRRLAYATIEGNDFSEIRNSDSPLTVVSLVPEKVTFKEDDLDKINEKPAEPDPVDVKVVKEGLDNRRRKLSIGSVTGVWPSSSGEYVYANVGGQFMKVNTASGRASAVPGVSGPVSGALDTGKALYVSQQGKIAQVVASGGMRPVPFMAVARVDMAQEELALFESAWWALDRMYYDPGMHGKDWPGIKDEFSKIVPYCTSRDDFYDLMGEMVERLDSSHMGSTSSDPYRADDREATGWLGVEWDYAGIEEGRYTVTKVYATTNASNPQMELMVGDRLVSVDGLRPGPNSPLAEILRGKSGDKVKLAVERGGQTITFDYQPDPLAAFSGAAYDDWVAYNKATVDKLSGGKLGYIHIKGMDEPSLDTFLREIATDLEGKEGVIVDVRYNGGGYTSHIILNVMRKVTWLIRTDRALPDIRFSENAYRGNALELPAACMTNEYSYSNAEIFSEGFQKLGLGPVIGEQTGGACIGTSSYSLWDGGAIRLPASGAYTVDMVDLENNGRKPTVDVQWNPVAWQNGHDVQLERAVQELMKKVK